jgi:hypothetical protein
MGQTLGTNSLIHWDLNEAKDRIRHLRAGLRRRL